MALEDLKRKSESMIMTKVLEIAVEETRMDIPLALESTAQSPVPSELADTLTKTDVLNAQPTTAMATLLEVELDLSKSDLLQRRTQKSPVPGPLPDIATGQTDLASTRHGEKETPLVQGSGDPHTTSNAPFLAFFDDSVIQMARKKLQALVHPETHASDHDADDGGPPLPLNHGSQSVEKGRTLVIGVQDVEFGGSTDHMKADLEVLSIQMPEQQKKQEKEKEEKEEEKKEKEKKEVQQQKHLSIVAEAERSSETVLESATTIESRVKQHGDEQST